MTCDKKTETLENFRNYFVVILVMFGHQTYWLCITYYW